VRFGGFWHRFILTAAALFFTPAGIFVLRGAFSETQPHQFIMLVFSGSLTLLVGLAALIGLVASFTAKEASGDQPSHE
jgi:hypothetical protein